MNPIAVSPPSSLRGRIFKEYFSATGLLGGTLFFAISLTPTLLPRTSVVQGVLSGLAMASGYGVGVFFVWFWNYFELAKPRPRVQQRAQLAAAGLFLFTAALSLWKSNGWQNEVRELMHIEEQATIDPFTIGFISVGLFFVLLAFARLFTWTFRKLSAKLKYFVPRRVSNVIGLMAAFFLFWSLVNGVLLSSILNALDSTYQQIDALLEHEFEPPADPMKAGSAASLLRWEEMGLQGRRFLSSGPTSEDLRTFFDAPLPAPIRVYVGMNAAKTPQARAQRALEELIRVNAFDRQVLLLITPTGTGWVDPAAIDAVEYLFKGNIASVAAQYSYLPSPISLLREGEYGAEMARALFRAVYGYWTHLPRETRPKLYLYGLSLGALNSGLSFDFYDIIDDPFQGVLWSGPPFRMELWRSITAERNPDSPAWKPRFRDGSVVRFANQEGGLETAEAPWGSFRMAFLQYASDPITFFSVRSATQEPEWLQAPRGPDVSPTLRWFPIVTAIQLMADMGVGTAPPGFGHVYAAEHYIDAWLALMEPEGWDEREIEKLKDVLAESR